jgi:hypothetical protein
MKDRIPSEFLNYVFFESPFGGFFKLNLEIPQEFHP